MSKCPYCGRKIGKYGTMCYNCYKKVKPMRDLMKVLAKIRKWAYG